MIWEKEYYSWIAREFKMQVEHVRENKKRSRRMHIEGLTPFEAFTETYKFEELATLSH